MDISHEIELTSYSTSLCLGTIRISYDVFPNIRI